MTEVRRYCAGDIGSNSIKVRVVEASADGFRKTLFEGRYAVRLGASSFEDGALSPADIESSLEAFRDIASVVRSFAVQHTRIVATSAVRESTNRDAFVATVFERTGLAIDVISGLEEARLLAIGQRPEMKRDHHNLVIDIGGGSTELIYTRTDLEIDTLNSLRLGAVRLYQSLKPKNPMTNRDFEQMQQSVMTMLEGYHLPVIARNTHVIGSAGTMRALADARAAVCAAPVGESFFTARDIERILRTLRPLSHAEMETRFGVEGRRAQIVIPGALIIAGIMDVYNIERVHVSNRSLRDGVLEELITQGDRPAHLPTTFDFGLRIGRKYQFNEAHGVHVAKLSMSLFDQLAPLHRMSTEARDLLELAALLHDTGQFVSYSKHHKHSMYLLMSEEFPGLSATQQQTMAVIARYHRKSPPSDKHPEYTTLPPAHRAMVDVGAAILRVADALDREHMQIVDRIDAQITKGAITLNLAAHAPVALEINAVRKKSQWFEKVFGRKLEISVAGRTPVEAL